MKNLRIYLATQPNCQPCEITKKELGKEVAGVPVYEVDLSTSPIRRRKMGVTATPTIFIVEVEDKNHDNILEEIEETHLFHQTGMIADKSNIEQYIKYFKAGNRISTPIK